jgi:hypothetical protein
MAQGKLKAAATVGLRESQSPGMPTCEHSGSALAANRSNPIPGHRRVETCYVFSIAHME